MKFFFAFLIITWLADVSGWTGEKKIRRIKRERGDIDARPGRKKSKRWGAKAILHGVMVYGHKDQKYIKRYKKRHPKWRSPDELKKRTG